jgi:hypothetical protein
MAQSKKILSAVMLVSLCWVSRFLIATLSGLMLSVLVLYVVMLNVVALSFCSYHLVDCLLVKMTQMCVEYMSVGQIVVDQNMWNYVFVFCFK